LEGVEMGWNVLFDWGGRANNGRGKNDFRDKVAMNYLDAVAAENWIGVQRIAKLHGHTLPEMLDNVFLSAAVLYAEGNEPARSPVFKAIWLLMVTFGDERIADAMQARHELDG
jgi:hypothetical protein